MKVQEETGELQNRNSDHMLLFVENKSYSRELLNIKLSLFMIF